MKKIVFTGGGTVGHVTLNLLLMPKFIEEGWEVHYIAMGLSTRKFKNQVYLLFSIRLQLGSSVAIFLGRISGMFLKWQVGFSSRWASC